MKKFFFCFLLLASHQASAFTNITVLGDSFFDGGNTDTAVTSYYKRTIDTNLTAPPYDRYRFTNGPTAAEYLATNLGLNNTSQFFNYAVGGATTTDIYNTVNSFPSNTTLDSQGLYVINGGGNDDFFSPAITPTQATQNIINTVTLLNTHGANYFIVLGLPTNSISEFSSFNTQLSTEINALNLTNSNVIFFDTAKFLSNALESQNGITNTSDPCLVNGVACSNPSEYIFWDERHFTTTIHQYIGQGLTLAATSAVPEPETYLMLLFGLFMLLFISGTKILALP